MFEVDNDDHWIPLADLMTGLMVIFLLISVAIMVKTIERHQQKIEQELKKNLPVTSKTVDNIGRELRQALGNTTLKASNVQFESDNLIIRFRGNLGLFTVGSSNITPQFQQQLNQFFPEYLQVVRKYESQISNVSIDGYASSFWGRHADIDKAYLLNMNLSQQRAKAVLEHIYHDVLAKQPQQQEFIRDYFTANGYSSSRAVINQDGSENSDLSQRVEFKIIIKSRNQ